jgi:hypothetical protein
VTWQDELRRLPVPGVDPTALAVLRAIAEHADYNASGHGARPAQRTLAQVTGLHPGTVRRATRRLEALDLVETVLGTGRTTTRYRVKVDALLDRLGRLLDPGPTPVVARAQTEPSARPGRAQRAPTTTRPTPETSLREPLEQLALALLDVDAREDVHPDRFALALAAAATLPPDTDPDRCRRGRRRWLELGRDPANGGPRTIARDLDDLAPTSPRHRPGRGARSPDCSTCDGLGLTLDADDRARPCPACTPETAR